MTIAAATITRTVLVMPTRTRQRILGLVQSLRALSHLFFGFSLRRLRGSDIQ